MSTRQIQQLETLRFCLYQRPLHPELFDIHEDIWIRKPNYEAQIWVTGCSHVVGFYRDKESLLEVVADGQTPLPSRGRRLDIPFRGEKAHETHTLEGIHYMMNFQAEVMTPRVYHGTHHELARQASRHGRFVPFPLCQSRNLTPFTYINYETNTNGIHVMAFHAFPKELTIIKTQSIFEIRQD